MNPRPTFGLTLDPSRALRALPVLRRSIATAIGIGSSLALGMTVATGASAQQAAQQAARQAPVQAVAAPLPPTLAASAVVLTPTHDTGKTVRVAGDTPGAPEIREPGEPNVKRSVIEDEGSRVEELRVRGQTQRIVVTPKVGTKKSYEIITDSGGREMYDGSGASRGAVGKRVWNVFNF